MFDSSSAVFARRRDYAPAERQVDFSRAPAARKVDPPPANTRAGARRFDGRLARLRSRRRAGDTPDLGVVRKHRTALRPDPLRHAQRDPGLGAGRARGDRADQAEVHRHDGRPERPPADPRAPAAGAAAATPAAATTAAPPLRHHAGAATTPRPRRQLADETPTRRAACASPRPSRAARAGFRHATSSAPSHGPRPMPGASTPRSRRCKSAGVPVFWVGLPSIRGPKIDQRHALSQRLCSARAPRRPASTYIDVWDGFVDENGRFAVQGPDFEGQIRRLRVSDGVHFTKAGARKLAHYVEREIRRVVDARRSDRSRCRPASRSRRRRRAAARRAVGAAAGRPGDAADRGRQRGRCSCLAAPTRRRADRSADRDPRAGRRARRSPTPAGRSDDFAWPRRGIAPFGTDPAVATTTDPLPVMQPTPVATVPVPTGDARAVGSRQSAPHAAAAPRRSSSRRQRRQQPQQQRSSSFRSFQTSRSAGSRCRAACVTAAAPSIPSGTCRSRGRIAGPRGSPRPRATGRGACRRRRTPWAARSGRRAGRP